MPKDRVIVGISGSSCVIIGIRLLEVLKKLGFETHLVISETAKKLIEHETAHSVKDVERLATYVYDNKDLFAKISSGSFKTNGMIIAPCSMKTLAGIANGYSENLMLRAADVCLKERRKLILVTRETPLNLIHIENMRKVTLAGGVILPPILTLYSKPKKIEDVIDHIIGKILDVMGIENEAYKRWG
ncbi:MAG: UbiX family flavin prenyltransferase [Candidatus Aenigmatarchaeota archaeon]